MTASPMTFSQVMNETGKRLASARASASPAVRAQLDTYSQRLGGQLPPHKAMDANTSITLLTRVQALAEKQEGDAHTALSMIAEALDQVLMFEPETLIEESLPPMPLSAAETKFERVRQVSSRRILRDEVGKMGTFPPPVDGMTRTQLEDNFPQLKRYIDRLFEEGYKHAPAGAMGPVPFEGMDVQMGFFRKSFKHNPSLLVDQESYKQTLKGFFQEKMAVIRPPIQRQPAATTRQNKLDYDTEIAAPFSRICARSTQAAGKALRDHMMAGLEKARQDEQQPDAQGFYAIEVGDVTLRACLSEKKRTLVVARECAADVEAAFKMKEKETRRNNEAHGWKAQFNNGAKQYKQSTSALERLGPRPADHPDMLSGELWGRSNGEGRGR